ncbi:MAG TPA: hypothetical protein VFY16_03140, partial [Gemmatimonadaceae bacterium]|nr:hypothetical protein [Gemmatimonadaceae bacterium]
MSATTTHRPSPHRAATLVAASVVALDLGTKELALRLLGDDAVSLGGGTFLGVVFNPSFVLGRTLGAHSLVAVTVVSLVVVALCALVCAPLASEDRRAPLLLGLVS